MINDFKKCAFCSENKPGFLEVDVIGGGNPEPICKPCLASWYNEEPETLPLIATAAILSVIAAGTVIDDEVCCNHCCVAVSSSESYFLDGLSFCEDCAPVRVIRESHTDYDSRLV